jgi:hypothetical protein
MFSETQSHLISAMLFKAPPFSSALGMRCLRGVNVEVDSVALLLPSFEPARAALSPAPHVPSAQLAATLVPSLSPARVPSIHYPHGDFCPVCPMIPVIPVTEEVAGKAYGSMQ